MIRKHSRLTGPRHGAVLLALLLTGCAVGPNFKRPAVPDNATYGAVPDATATADAPAGTAQRFAVGEDVRAAWWTVFQSKPLDDLIARALAANPDLAAAEANLRQVQEVYYGDKGAYFPTVDAGFHVTRQKISGANFGNANAIPPFTISTASVNVAYGLDLWGGLRRSLESLKAQTETARFQFEAAYLTLASNVVATAIENASFSAQIAATKAIIDAERHQLDVVKRQFDVGGASQADVLAQTATLAQTEATLPQLQKNLDQSRTRLAALAGGYPGDDIAAFDLTALKLPIDLPVTVPSKLVAQRPDIRAAEEAMHAASAQVGVATANLLPQVSLSASYGTTATDMGNLFSPGSGIWSLAAGLTQPVFHGGELIHARRAAVAAFDKASAQYRSTVLTAFENVADSLRALQTDADGLAAETAAAKAANDSLAVAQTRFNAGATSYITLLNAENTAQQARVALIQAEAARFSDTAALFVALGGGWWNRPDAGSAETAAAPGAP